LALVRADGTQKDQGEVDVLGVSPAGWVPCRARGQRSQIALDPSEGQALIDTWPDGEKEAFSHCHQGLRAAPPGPDARSGDVPPRVLRPTEGAESGPPLP
jgi:hypothetical protein